MYREYVICSNPSCKFSTEGNEHMLKACPLCAAALVYKCPKCRQRLSYRNALFCHQCATALKPQIEPVDKKNRSHNKGSN